MTEPYKKFLCEYPFGGERWRLEIMARSRDEAAARLKAMPWGEVKGEHVMSIPAHAGAGLFVRALCLMRNLWSGR